MRANLFGLGISSKSRAVTAKKLTNLYCEVRPKGEKSQIVAYGNPGLDLFVSFGDTPCRAGFAQNDFLYAIHRGTFWQVNNAGVRINRGTLDTTTGRCDVSSNGVEIMAVDGSDGYIYNTSTNAFTKISSGFFSNPTTVTWQDGYFISSFANSGRFQISALYDGLTWDALAFANAESSPDDLKRVIADHGEICPFGEFTAEFWGNSGGDFPYTAIRGATNERGLAATWSLCKYNDGLAFLGKNVAGQVQVMLFKGYTPTVISNPDMDAIINSFASVADCTAFSFNWKGHPFLQLNFPSVNRSFRYDSTTTIWSEVTSYGGRHRAEMCVDYLNKPRMFDYENGNVYTVSDTTYTDNGNTIESEIISETIRAPDGQRFPVNRLRLEMETGVGLQSGQGEDPQAMLQISRDGGYTWGAEIWAPFGRIGEYGRRVEWFGLGSSDQFTFKIRVTDPVKRVFLSASINPTD